VFFEHHSGERVYFTLEHYLHSRTFKAEVEPPDARKEGSYSHQ